MELTRIAGPWVAALALAAVVPAQAETPAGADAAAYEQLKSLAGLWAGKVSDESAMDVQVGYEVKSGGVDIQAKDGDHIEVDWHFQKGTRPAGSKRMLFARAAAAG